MTDPDLPPPLPPELTALADQLGVDLSGCAGVAAALMRLSPDPALPKGADDALERLATALGQGGEENKK